MYMNAIILYYCAIIIIIELYNHSGAITIYTGAIKYIAALMRIIMTVT